MFLLEPLDKTLIPEALSQEVEILRKSGFSIILEKEGNLAKLTIASFPLPDGYSKQHSDLLILIPISYPNGKPDMFWVEKDVVLANGQVPQKADNIETHVGRRWRRFSWHLSRWNPGCDDLNTYLSFVENGLLKARDR